MINPKTSYKQEAAAFIKFMLTDDISLAFSELTGRLPTRKTVFSNPKIPQMPELVGFLKAVENVYVNPTLPGYGEINDIYGEAYQSVFTKMATVEQAAAKARQRAQAICDAANSQ
jgi:maltose-binding protein MalE